MERAKEGLREPSNWSQCNPLWCSMNRVPDQAGKKCHLEVISLDCNNSQLPQLKVCLCFEVVIDQNDLFYMTYDMCPNQREGNGTIVVDKGSILIERQGTSTCVASTKYVRFLAPMDGPSFAMTLCAAGYGYAAQDFVFTCEREPA
jgi:hypothetical protein